MKDRSTLLAYIFLVLVMLLALVLRFYRLDAQSLWYDEGFSIYLARMDLAQITARTAADIQPPLYYYLLHGWMGLLGDGERVLRGLSALFGVLTAPLMYAVALRLFRSRLAGLLAALLVAVSPVHVWYGQEARMYTLLTFLCLLSSYFLLLAMRQSAIPIPSGSRPSSRQGREGRNGSILFWLAFTLTSITALYTHYFASFVLAFQGLYVL
ncbi:MAG: glycosyltransferase family 39 protein, partial [Anaerolineae bacterium]